MTLDQGGQKNRKGKRLRFFFAMFSTSEWSYGGEFRCYDCLSINDVCLSVGYYEQWSGGFLGITCWDPSVCKSNRLYVNILLFSFINLGIFYKFL